MQNTETGAAADTQDCPALPCLLLLALIGPTGTLRDKFARNITVVTAADAAADGKAYLPRNAEQRLMSSPPDLACCSQACCSS